MIVAEENKKLDIFSKSSSSMWYVYR